MNAFKFLLAKTKRALILRLMMAPLILCMGYANAQVYDMSTGNFKGTITFTGPGQGTMVFEGAAGTDPIEITENGDKITMVRDCRPISKRGACSQTWTGAKVDGGRAMSGAWSGTGGRAPWTAKQRLAAVYDFSTGPFKGTITMISDSQGMMAIDGRRGTDPLSVTSAGNAITMVRDCRPISNRPECSQTWTGTNSGKTMSGTYRGTGGSAPWTATLRGPALGAVMAQALMAPPPPDPPSALTAAAGKFDGKQDFYWKDSYPRGVGVAVHACPNGTKPDAGLCYEACPSGWSGVGPLCHAQCPSNWGDIGVSCKKPGNVGVLYTIANTASQAACNQIGRGTTCVQRAAKWPLPALWVPYITGTKTIFQPCPDGFEGTGDNATCKPKCPQNFRDDGLFCAKPVAQSRKGIGGGYAGTPMTCSPTEDYDAGLCYPRNRDPSKYSCVGPVCWMKVPPGFVDCGFGVAKDKVVCASVTASQTYASAYFASKLTPAGKAAVAAVAARKAKTDPKELEVAVEVAEELAKNRGAFKRAADKLIAGGKDAKDGMVALMKPMTDVYSGLGPNKQKALGIGAQEASRALKAGITWQPNGLFITRNLAGAVSVVDPTGIFGVIEAFAYPVWGVDYPF